MKKLLISLFILLPLLVIGQPETENYVKSTSYQEAFTLAEVNSTSNPIPEDQKIESITYFDGIGRPKQSITQRAGGNHEDLVTPIQYDELGRQAKDHLPYPVPFNNGLFIESPFGAHHSYYLGKFPNDSDQTNQLINAYSQKSFENSPLNRALEQGAPGMDWKIDDDPNVDSDHTIKFEYQTNASWEVRRFRIDFNLGNTQDPILLYGNDEKYPANQLYKTITKNENWQPNDGPRNTTEEFKNKLGQVVLKRSFAAGTWTNIDTYYVYDDFGNLTYVLSPETENNIISSGELVSNYQLVLDDLCYQYKYDYRNRLIEKKIPGKGWEEIVYDKLDRPILTRDKNLKDNDSWLFTKYDALGRVAYTGKFGGSGSSTRENVQNLVNNYTVFYEERTNSPTNIGGTQVYYTATQTYPISPLEVLTVNYYDDYDYIDMDGLDVPTTVFTIPTASNTTGLPTVSKVRVLGTNDWITSVTGYDNKGRSLISRSKNNYLNTEDYVANKLDFTGKVTESLTSHSKDGNATIHTSDYFTYDHVGRLLTHKQKIDNEHVQLIASNNYDELGQLVAKGVGGIALVDGYTDLTNVDVSSNGVITNNYSGTQSWQAKAKTKGEIPSNYEGGIDFIVSQTDKDIRGGLIFSSNSNQSNDYFNYGIFVDFNNGSNQIKLLINGVVNPTSETYTAPMLFRIEREIIFDSQGIPSGGSIEFYKGSSNIHSETLTVEEINNPLVGKVVLDGNTGGSVSDVNLFGPMLNKTLQSINYAYNIRGWLTDINDVDHDIVINGFNIDQYNDLFNFRINYNLPIEGTAANLVTPLYNGNISQTIWKTINGDGKKRTYGYKYDPLNRLTDAHSKKEDDLSTADEHSVYNISYDKNGNLEQLGRHGAGGINAIWDDLVYEYSAHSNKLINVTDNSSSTLKSEGFNDGHIGTVNTPDYDYDDNGNMVLDKNKGITSPITYNHLNLPEVVTIDNGIESGTISYVYDALGIKLKKTLIESGVNSLPKITQYAGNYIYLQVDGGDNILQFFNHPEGYIEPTPLIPAGGEETKSVEGFDGGTGTVTYSSYMYIFQYKDHLGNVRLSYADSDLNGSVDPVSEIIEESNYYPFGLQHKGYNNVVNGTENNHFTYVGQELNESLDYNMLEMDWRHYDPAIGRFVGIDALAENYYNHTPYHYSKNSPIMYSDPTGLSPEALTTWVHNTETDEMLWVDDDYNFTLDVSNDEFNQIKSSGAIESGTSAYNRWFWKAVWEDLTTSDGSISDDVTQFMITDEVEDGLEMIDGVSNGQYLTAGLTLMLRKVQKGKKGYKLIKKLFKKGKMPTPDLNPDQFKKVGNTRVHRKTGAIYKKSNTSHGNVGNKGDQWKAYPKGTTDFGKTSKTTGTRVTIDGDGNVIGN